MLTWIILRAAGIGAYLMLFGTVSWGLIATTNIGGKRISRNTATLVHQFLSTGAVLLLGVHLGGLLLDTFVPFAPLDLLVPLRASFKPVAVAVGIVTMYLMLVVLGSSWMRKRIGTKWWRRMHLFAIPMFSLALIHGVFAGTDTLRPWMWWTYMVTGGAVLFLILVRGLTVGFRPERAPRPANARPRPTGVPTQAPERDTHPVPMRRPERQVPVDLSVP